LKAAIAIEAPIVGFDLHVVVWGVTETDMEAAAHLLGAALRRRAERVPDQQFQLLAGPGGRPV
jgi:hypothetical protein